MFPLANYLHDISSEAIGWLVGFGLVLLFYGLAPKGLEG